MLLRMVMTSAGVAGAKKIVLLLLINLEVISEGSFRDFWRFDDKDSGILTKNSLKTLG